MPRFKQKEFTRMNTKSSDFEMKDGDLRLMVNAEYDKAGSVRKVKGYTQAGDTLSAILTQRFTSNDDWNSGTLSSTVAENGNLVLKGSNISQLEHNDSHQVHGDNWIAQSFKATSNTLDKLTLFVDKVLGATLLKYEERTGSGTYTSMPSAQWSVTGTAGQNITDCLAVFGRVGGSEVNTTVKTDNKTNGDPILGFRVSGVVNTKPSNGAFDGFSRIEMTNGTDFIRFQYQRNPQRWVLSSGGSYGTGEHATLDGGTLSTPEIKEDGGDTVVLVGGVEKKRFTSKAVASNSYFQMSCTGIGGGGGENYAGIGNNSSGIAIVGDLHLYQSVEALTDIDIRLETDSSGPSGTLVTNGSTTIDDVDVEESISQVDAIFSTPPTTVVDDTYWVVIKQTGGDANNHFRVYKENSNVYDNGDAYASTNGGSTWAAEPDGTTDLAFIIYGSPASAGTWISPNITLSSGQVLQQLVINHTDLSSDDKITQIDILNTSDVVQSSYTTDIVTGSQTILRGSDFDNGFTYTNGNNFRVKVSLASGGSVTPVVSSIQLDSPTREIVELSPFYQSSGTKALMAVVAGTLKRLTTSIWSTINNSLTATDKVSTTIFRAHKGEVVATGTAASGNLTSLTGDIGQEPGANDHQGKFIKIVGGKGSGQVRVIQSHDGTTTSTTTSTSTSTSTTTTAT